jgi:hypothetical protein
VITGNCAICNRPVPGWEPILCCSGYECGCMGQPTEPCVCSNKCEAAVYDYIGYTMDERRIKAGIDVWGGDV